MKLKLSQGSLSWDSKWQSVEGRWRLEEIKVSPPISYDHYRSDELHWNAKTYESLEEQSVEEAILKQYVEYVTARERFYGYFDAGDVVELVLLERNVLLLTDKWEGQARRKDHRNLELWLRAHLGVTGMQFTCEVYSFGMMFVPSGGIEEAMGEQPGLSLVSRFRGEPRVVFSQNVLTFEAAGEFGWRQGKTSTKQHAASARFEAI